MRLLFWFEYKLAPSKVLLHILFLRSAVKNESFEYCYMVFFCCLFLTKVDCVNLFRDFHAYTIHMFIQNKKKGCDRIDSRLGILLVAMWPLVQRAILCARGC